LSYRRMGILLITSLEDELACEGAFACHCEQLEYDMSKLEIRFCCYIDRKNRLCCYALLFLQFRYYQANMYYSRVQPSQNKCTSYTSMSHSIFK
jgi:hypothetical protein